MKQIATETIENADDPRVTQYHSLRLQQQGQSFIADGLRTVLYALEAKLKIKSIFAKDQFLQDHRDLLHENIEHIYIARNEVMEKIVGHKLHQGVMAEIDTPPVNLFAPLSGPIIALDDIRQPENVGSIIRNGIGLGIDQFLFSKFGGPPYLRRTVRVSMGSVFRMKYNFSENLASDLQKLQKSGYKVIACEITESSQDMNEVEISGTNNVLVFGNESEGVCSEILEIADLVLHISMAAKMSLNVASSSAIFIHKLISSL